MTQPPGEEPDENLDAPAPQHVLIKPVHGNARRRTLLLLLATGLTVVGIHFGLAAGKSATPSAAGSSGSPPSPSASGGAAGLTYYVSSTGSDSAAGTSPATAWRTLARADQQSFRPGQRLLLQGGATFTGSLEFKAGVAGDAAHPVVVGSYGTGQAVISSAHAPAVTIYNTAGITLQNLTIKGPGANSSANAGVDVYNTLSGNRKLAGLTLTGLDVSGYRDGISIGGGAGTAGFTDVSITDTKAHANRDNGIITFGPSDLKPSAGYPIQSLTISGVAAYDNLGNASDHQGSTGSGISLGGVSGGTVENSVAYGNGGDCDSESGPVGIWAHDSTGVVIEHNVSYSNRTAGYTDGGGFDLDQSTFDSVLEYNLTYNNYGPGYMVYAGHSSAASSGNVVRFNVSMNDALSPTDNDSITYGLLMVDGYETDVEVYHNTVVQNGHGAESPLLNLGSSLHGASIRDNVFIAEFGSLIKTSSSFHTSQVELQGNAYYSLAAHWRLQWGGNSYTSLSDWRASTGQETLNGNDTGSSTDPGLAQGPAASWDPTHTQVPVPQPGAAAATAGIDLSTNFGTNPGNLDYYGQAVSIPAMQGAVMAAPSSAAGAATTTASASPSTTTGN
ncbi:right-handed parallel beta-helix repeat-containing protein [Actinospica durhamensis]|uniref:Right-handed parallel beta-helix repeat-containing protein n=1 Tax=Actinospica durhamensis TaxID=1508375 RepID=A0A941EKB5_9ACTN|nr:right-handed parallel beta-helix repeat-containing protein [Actinospica durhamensis]MBR7833162.1 right-handed parallel beta-helix repeat-containing protein [Actinospica durhamensis]